MLYNDLTIKYLAIVEARSTRNIWEASSEEATEKESESSSIVHQKYKIKKIYTKQFSTTFFLREIR